jgi:excisionase family DNA binding protein
MTAPAPILVSREDAAQMLGMSLRHFQRFVQPHVRIVRVGQRRLIPVAELERWAEEKAQKTSA